MAIKEIANNRKARHDYFIEDTIEAGIVLYGTEIKSIRNGKASFNDAYISFYKGEAILKGLHISAYSHGNRFNHDEDRERKLLLHKREITKLFTKSKVQNYTIVPLRLYLKDGLAKVEIALAKGKNLYDKRESDKIASMKREIEKAVNY